MFSKLLISLGLILTPYTIWPGKDIRDIKLDIAGIIALALGLSVIYEYGLKPHRNKWLMYLLFAVGSFYLLAPVSPIAMFGMDISLFWIWRPMYYCLVFALMLFAVSSMPLGLIDLSKIMRMMTWCGFIMSCYVILQCFKIDQFFTTCTDDTWGHMAGFVGNPTHVSPYIAMIIPIALYLKRYAMVLIMCIATVITTSQVAIGALVVVLLIQLALQSKKSLAMVCILVSILIGVSVYGYGKGYITRDTFEDHERLMTWKQISTDTITPQLVDSKAIFPLTGLGIGTFKYVFHFQHNNRFQQAHNEYLELAYNVGWLGLLLFLGAIFVHIKESFRHISFYGFFKTPMHHCKIAFLCSLIYIMIVAGGTFIWQVGTTAFYTVLVAGILKNDVLS